MEILNKNQKEMLEIESPVTKMKNAFDALTGRWHSWGKKNPWPEDTSIKTAKMKSKEKTDWGKSITEYSRTLGQLQKV